MRANWLAIIGPFLAYTVVPSIWDRFMSTAPPWALSSVQFAVVVLSTITLLFLDPVYERVHSPTQHPISSTLIFALAIGALAGSAWWSFATGNILSPIKNSDYRELVANIITAIDPTAHVAVNNAINGPDGFRHVDIEVRSQDGRLTAIDVIDQPRGHLVGVDLIDRADSKRADIKADEMVVCSNTGFDELALRKAKRVRITLISAVKQGDQTIKAVIQEEI